MLKNLIAGILILFACLFLVALVSTFEASGPWFIAFVILGMVFVGLPTWLAFRLARKRRASEALAKPAPAPAVPPPRRESKPAGPDPRVQFEIEVLKLARRHEGRLTAMEVVTELGVGVDKAKAVLADLNDRGIAGMLISDSGLVVYNFQELEDLDEKDSARPLLD